MTDVERRHVQARELAETIATRLAKLESEREILAQIDRLRALVASLVEGKS
jgi:hypothetical protein